MLIINSIIVNSIIVNSILRTRKGEAENSELLTAALSVCSAAIMQEPHWSFIIRTKDTALTQEMTRVSGALCQEPESKTKY